jgi:hypothetical protein
MSCLFKVRSFLNAWCDIICKKREGSAWRDEGKGEEVLSPLDRLDLLRHFGATSKSEGASWMSEDKGGGADKQKVRVASSTSSASTREENVHTLERTKLSLTTAKNADLALSAALWTLILPLEIRCSAIAEIKRFANETRGVSNRRKGKPHAHAFRKVLQSLIANSKTDGQAARQKLQLVLRSNCWTSARIQQ